MNIAEACKTVRLWLELFLTKATSQKHPGELVEFVAVVKAYLEREKVDGKPIRELEISEHLLAPREGVRWVMPFALSAESIETSKCLKALG